MGLSKECKESSTSEKGKKVNVIHHINRQKEEKHTKDRDNSFQ